MTLKVNPLVIVTVIAALLYLHAQQPPRAKREPVARPPKTPPDNQDGIDKTYAFEGERFNPRAVNNRRNVHWIGEN